MDISAGNGTTFRVADSGDHGLVVRLLGELVDELGPPPTAGVVKSKLEADIERALANENVRIFLAEQKGEALGLSRADILINDPIFRLRADVRCGYVDQMYVRPSYRGKGIGRELLKLCEEWFREHGLGHCLLHAAPKAVRFYAEKGYQANRQMFKRL